MERQRAKAVEIGKRRAAVEREEKQRARREEQQRVERAKKQRIEREEKQRVEREEKRRADDARPERLRRLRVSKSRYDCDIVEFSLEVRKLKVEQKRLQEQHDEALRKEEERNKWWTSLASSVFGKIDRPEQEKREWEAEDSRITADMDSLCSELSNKESELRRVRDILRYVNGKIAIENEMAEEAARERAIDMRYMVEQEAERRARAEMRERRPKAQEKEAKPTVRARAARQEQERHEARCAEQERKWEEHQERDKMEVEERAKELRAQAKRDAEETTRKAQSRRSKPAAHSQNSSHGSGPSKSVCQHNMFWARVEGKHRCSRCDAVQNHFTFQCPGCKIMACASCRETENQRAEESSFWDVVSADSMISCSNYEHRPFSHRLISYRPSSGYIS